MIRFLRKSISGNMNKSRSKKIAFLDRDGVINKKAKEHCYITEIKDFIFNEGIFDVVSKLKSEGFEFIIITNQRGVARGLLTEEKLNEIHQYMVDEFKKREVDILDIFYCPHDNDSCDCRKPKDGMLRQACTKYDLNLKVSFFISDEQTDLDMAEKFGIGKRILVAFQ